MALANYTDLIASINGSGAWLHRTDLAAIAPDFVTLAEATMNYGDLETLGVSALRTGNQEETTTTSLGSGVTTINLPSDFLEMRKVYLNINGVKRELIQAPIIPMRLSELSNVLGVPETYVIVGSTLVPLPGSNGSYSITMDYYATIGPLATQNTNWLMTMSPQTYLAGAIVHGAPWFGPKFNPAPWVAMFKQGMGQVVRADVRKRMALTTLRSEVAGLQNQQFNILTGVL